MENSPKVKAAMDKAFKYLDSLSPEKFEKEISKHEGGELFQGIFEARECNDCKQLQAENEQLKKDLKEYGNHNLDCKKDIWYEDKTIFPTEWKSYDCTCGFDKIDKE